VTVLFDAVGFKTFDLELVRERSLIAPVADGNVATTNTPRSI